MSQSSVKIKVLLVDDSSFMRVVLADIINAHPKIEVTDTASNGKEAIEKTLTSRPNVVLLDLTMADYDGMYALQKIMEQHPVPVIILSSIRSTNPRAIVEALNAGAYDFLDKPTGLVGSKIRQIEDQICHKIIEASQVDPQNLVLKIKKSTNFNHSFQDSTLHYQIIAIGASTGGTGAIEHILMNFPKNLPVPVVICQHMPADFIVSYAERLGHATQLLVKVAAHNEPLVDGTIYLLPGHINTKIVKNNINGQPHFEFTSEIFEEYNHPSIDCMMQSVAEVYLQKSIGIILTGMGKDGTFGLSKIFKNGGYTIAQDQKSCVVYGMPKAAFEANIVNKVVSLHDMPSFIISAIA